MERINNKLLKQLLASLNISSEEKDILLSSILTKRQFKIFKLKYNLDGDILIANIEIAKQENVTCQSISQTLNSAYKRIINYCKKQDPNNPVFNKNTKSRKRQLIESINELHRLPGVKNGLPEKTFESDGIDQRGYYETLQSRIKNIKKKLLNHEKLTKQETQDFKDYNEIQKALKKQEDRIKLSNNAKELIKTIKKLHRLPKLKLENNMPEAIFSDGTNQRGYFDYLNTRTNEISRKKSPLTKKDKQALYDYQEICKVLKKYKHIYKRILSDEEKVKEYIDTLKECKHKPKVKTKKSNEETLFSDGTVQRTFYNRIRNEVRIIKERQLTLPEGEELTDDEKEKLSIFDRLNEAIAKYCTILTISEKVDLLIDSINELKRLPKRAEENNGIAEKSFPDNTSQNTFYYITLRTIKRAQHKLDNNQPITKKEEEYFKAYNKIKNVFSFYNRKTKNIELIINLCQLLNIDTNINEGLLNKSFSEVYSKLAFLIEHNFPLINNKGNVNEIFFQSDLNMQAQFNISLETLVKKYVNGDNNAIDASNMLVKIRKTESH